MGQKTNPIGNRLGIIRGWDSNWFGGNDYGDRIAEDYKIRRYLEARLSKGGISRIFIERTLKLVTVTITTARPGLIIGKGGQEVDKLKEELKKITDKDIQINIFEIKRPELDAILVAESKTFSNLLDASFFENLRIANALSTSTPLMMSATNLIFLGEEGQSLCKAFATSWFAILRANALSLFLDPMIIYLLYFCYHRDL